MADSKTYWLEVGGATFRAQFWRKGEEGCWLYLEDGSPWYQLHCVIEEPPEPGFFWLKDWSENEGIVSILNKAGLLTFSGRQWVTGRVITREARLLVEPKLE